MERSNEPKIIPAEACNLRKIAERIQSLKHALGRNTLPVLVVEATSKCNLSCVFCGMHSKQLLKPNQPVKRESAKRKMHMDLSLFNETIKKCRGMEKLKVLYLHGHGEPLLNPNIVKMVNIAKRGDIAEQIILITNGVLLTRKIFGELVEAGLTSVRISLDVISPQKFREVKRVDVSRKVLANIDACIELIKTEKLQTSLIILCVDPEDKEFTEETKRIFKYFGQQIKGLPNVSIQHRKIFNWVDSIKRLRDGGEYQRPVPCEQPFYLLMVHSDGDISMCCADTTKESVIGNIRKVNCLKEILTSETLSIRRKHLLEQNYEMLSACKYCEVYSSVNRILLEKREELLELLPK